MFAPNPDCSRSFRPRCSASGGGDPNCLCPEFDFDLRHSGNVPSSRPIFGLNRALENERPDSMSDRLTRSEPIPFQQRQQSAGQTPCGARISSHQSIVTAETVLACGRTPELRESNHHIATSTAATRGFHRARRQPPLPGWNLRPFMVSIPWIGINIHFEDSNLLGAPSQEIVPSEIATVIFLRRIAMNSGEKRRIVGLN
jgi:hypothetical protein